MNTVEWILCPICGNKTRDKVGKNIKLVCKRFLDSGMTPEQVAKRMDVPIKLVTSCLR